MTTTHGIRDIPGHGNSLRLLFDAFLTRRQRRRESGELQAQSNFVLKDIGLTRSKIKIERERVGQWLRLEWH